MTFGAVLLPYLAQFACGYVLMMTAAKKRRLFMVGVGLWLALDAVAAVTIGTPTP